MADIARPVIGTCQGQTLLLLVDGRQVSIPVGSMIYAAELAAAINIVTAVCDEVEPPPDRRAAMPDKLLSEWQKIYADLKHSLAGRRFPTAHGAPPRWEVDPFDNFMTKRLLGDKR